MADDKDQNLENRDPKTEESVEKGFADEKTQEVKNEEVKDENVEQEDFKDEGKPDVDAKDAKIAELEDQLLRTRAEFANYKRRTTEETIRLGTYTTCQVVEKFLKVLDNFERAEAALTESTEQALVDGLQKIRKQFEETLKKLDVEEIKALNEKFDPNLHEAVMRGENPEMEEDTIDQVFEKGYKIRENVIRHSKVRVISK